MCVTLKTNIKLKLRQTGRRACFEFLIVSHHFNRSASSEKICLVVSLSLPLTVPLVPPISLSVPFSPLCRVFLSLCSVFRLSHSSLLRLPELLKLKQREKTQTQIRQNYRGSESSVSTAVRGQLERISERVLREC